ncbi:PRC-barrel domain-containing protein [Streptomyces sp. CA-146814]|uniref:PRC-barrel domain-containing protein n=1 Tax=Streptomyces sp. CA-146814 TaxID=3240053 RepID=UPI003D932FD8
MGTNPIPVLTKLSDSPHVIASPDEDILGRKVTDRSGTEIGKVGDLVIDENEQRVRFLILEHGGLLGIGGKETYIPVDAVSEVTDDRVHIDRTRDDVAQAPGYDPELLDQNEYYGSLYSHYGYTPFWGAGYVSRPFHP